MLDCARPDCHEVGTKSCSACLKEFYCSGKCQQIDWKAHKIMCHLIKLMPETLVPLRDARLVVKKVVDQTEAQIAILGNKRHAILLEHAAIFAGHQFDQRIMGSVYLSRENGDRIEAWEVEMGILYKLYGKFINKIMSCNDSGNMQDCWTSAIPYNLKRLALLESWMLQILSMERVDMTLEMLELLFDRRSTLETELSVGYTLLNDWDKVQFYCEQSVSHAKLLKEGETKIKKVINVFNNQSDRYSQMSKIIEAKAVIEETYMYVSEMYDHEHPLVLKASSHLIQVLISTKDFYNAERFARICYECLTRSSLDPESYDAGDAARNLALASCELLEANGLESANIEEAEKLARESVRIMKILEGSTSGDVKSSFNVLVRVLTLKNDCGDDLKSVLEDQLSYAIRGWGTDAKITSIAHADLGIFHNRIVDTLSCDDAKRKHLHLVEFSFKEAFRIHRKYHDLENGVSEFYASQLSAASIALEEMGNDFSLKEL